MHWKLDSCTLTLGFSGVDPGGRATRWNLARLRIAHISVALTFPRRRLRGALSSTRFQLRVSDLDPCLCVCVCVYVCVCVCVCVQYTGREWSNLGPTDPSAPGYSEPA
jgi:hypothetical protein